jgi:hypothetical protein
LLEIELYHYTRYGRNPILVIGSEFKHECRL